MKVFSFFIFLLFSQTIEAQFAAPVGAYLNGVGGVVGVAAGKRKIWDQGGNLLAIKTFGRVDAHGFLFNDLPILTKNLKLNIGVGKLNKLDHEVAYSRGLSEGFVIRQEIEGEGHSYGLKYHFLNDRLKLGYQITSIRTSFVDFKTREGAVFNIERGAIHDVTPDIKTISLDADIIPKRLDINLSLTNIEGRLAQSDVRVLGYKINGSENFGKRFKLRYTTQFQKTSVTRLDTTSSLVDGRCNDLNNESHLIEACQAFQNDINQSIVGSNQFGTAPPLGGSRGPRSYREFRFRAANTAFHGLEGSYQAFRIKNYPVNLISFLEVVHADDRLSNLWSHARYSTGLGFRTFVKEIPIRAEFATGNEGQAAFFTFGMPW